LKNKLFRSHYRWYVLALTMLTYGTIAGAERMAMPVLFKEISSNLNLDLLSVGAIWGADPVAGVFIGLPGGLLADRFGIKRTLTVVCILSGIFCALRGFSANFAMLAVTTFVFGIMAAMAPSIVPKTTAVWFSRKQLGLTNALLQVAFSVGAMFATMTSATILSPFLGGWRNVLFLLGAPAVVIGLLWLFTGREPHKDEVQNAEVAAVPLRQALSKVIRIKEVWIYGFIALTLWGANMGLNGYLPLYLRDSGWSPAAADGAITVLMASSLVGVIPMVLLANRLKAQREFFLFSMIVMIISLILIPILVGSAAVWPLLITGSFLRSAMPALMNTLIFEIKGVGGTYGGTAIGLASSIGMAGATFAPPAGNSLSVFGLGVPFFFWAALAAISLPAFLVLKRISNREKSAINA
jgi:NNP family nitrate/nitrite transporter-like MFS transporter